MSGIETAAQALGTLLPRLHGEQAFELEYDGKAPRKRTWTATAWVRQASSGAPLGDPVVASDGTAEMALAKLLQCLIEIEEKERS